MLKQVERIQRLIAPDPETLWEHGGAEIRSMEIDSGRYENVPFFDVEEITAGIVTQTASLDELGRHVSDSFTQTLTTPDGIDRATRLHLPTDEYRNPNYQFVIQMNTAWLTSIDGHNDVSAELLSRVIGVPVIEIGAEHSSRKYPFPLDGIRLATTFRQARTISQAKTAQSSQRLTQYLCHKYDLPMDQVKLGESRGAMEAPAENIYAHEYGGRICYTDTTAPCIPEQLFSDPGDLFRLSQFPASEVAGFAIVAIEAARKRSLSELKGTLSANPNFWLSSIVGNGPALMSGEAGRFPAWVPRDEATGNIHIVTFKNDAVSRPDVWKRLYELHPGIAIITLSGTHVTLAHTETIRHSVDRVTHFGDEFYRAGGNLNKMNWKNVHLKDDDSIRQMV